MNPILYALETAVMAGLFIFTVCMAWAVGKEVFTHEGEK